MAGLSGDSACSNCIPGSQRARAAGLSLPAAKEAACRCQGPAGTVDLAWALLRPLAVIIQIAVGGPWDNRAADKSKL